jgi:hypothetical protein
MEIDHLGFTCPQCRVDLVVPASAAGVEGPCPRCSELIRAPRFTQRREEQPVRLEVKEDAIGRAKPLSGFQPIAQQPLVESTAMQSGRASNLRRTLLATAVLAVVTSIVFFAVLGRDAVPEPPMRELGSDKAPSRDKELDAPAMAQASPERNFGVAPEGLVVHEFVSQSAKVLGAFLAARSLEDRLPFMEFSTSLDELEQSVLAGPLGSTGDFESLEVRFDKVLSTNEVIFKCAFHGGKGNPDSCLVMVRTRGGQQAKVVAEPFLDIYGGRFKAFAESPKGEVSKFRIVATIFDFCTDDEVPERELKCTMKISGAPGSPDLGKAYFGKASPLREKLRRLGMRYGQGTGATVTLKWNTQGTPHIEVIDVDSLDWSE